MPTKITSIEQLKAEAEQGAEFFILLNHALRSSKDIVWDAQSRKFHVFNHIDQNEQHLTERQFFDRGFTNIRYHMISQPESGAKRRALFMGTSDESLPRKRQTNFEGREA